MLSLQQLFTLINARAHLHFWLCRSRQTLATEKSLPRQPEGWCKRRLDDDGLRLNSWREELRWTNTTQTANLYNPTALYWPQTFPKEYFMCDCMSQMFILSYLGYIIHASVFSNISLLISVKTHLKMFPRNVLWSLMKLLYYKLINSLIPHIT